VCACVCVCVCVCVVGGVVVRGKGAKSSVDVLVQYMYE
jgi:hypothetical protein